MSGHKWRRNMKSSSSFPEKTIGQGYRDCLSVGAVWPVLLHNDWFCNCCITKRCLHKSRNVSHNDLVHNCSTIKGKSNKKCIAFCHVLSNIGFSYEGKAFKGEIRFVMQSLQNPTLYPAFLSQSVFALTPKDISMFSIEISSDYFKISMRHSL
jgi:hypothetical protein